MICVELTGAVDAAGTERTFYLSDRRFVTKPSDTPASVSFDDSLLDPGSIGMTAFGDGRTGGATRPSLGEMALANSDGQYDPWLDYSFDGRAIVIRKGAPGADYPSAFTPVFSGTVEALTVTRKQVVIRLRDRQFVFDRPALSAHYAGTNALPNGLEGTADDIKGQARPRLYGRVFNIAPPCVNTSKLTYQISDGAVGSIEGVYDRGLALTPGADYATSAALQGATVPSGTWASCLAEGLFRLGSAPAGQVTVDASQGSAGTVAQILTALALAAGVDPAQIAGADAAALDMDAPYPVGVWLTGDVTFIAAMDQVAASVGAYYAFDAAGRLRMGRLTAPAGPPVRELQDFDILGAFERRPARDGDLPSWSCTVRHSKLWESQGADLAAGVSAARRAFLATEFRSARAEDPAVRTKFLLAAEDSVDTLLTSAADAAAEAQRRLNLHKARRDFFDVEIPAGVLAGLDLMSVVSITNPRFGLAAGRLFRVLGADLKLARDRAILTLWG